MSTYGRIWQEISDMRSLLAAHLRRSKEALPTLAEARDRAAEHKAEADRLLARWTALEAEASRCDGQTGEPPR